MSSPPDASDPLDRTQIEFLVSLDEGQGELLAEVVSEFLIVSEKCSTELVRLLGEGDCPAVERTAHTLKGASANVGATGLADACSRLESSAHQGQLSDAAEHMERFGEELERVRAALEIVDARV
jgi:hypothetical protein